MPSCRSPRNQIHRVLRQHHRQIPCRFAPGHRDRQTSVYIRVSAGTDGRTEVSPAQSPKRRSGAFSGLHHIFFRIIVSSCPPLPPTKTASVSAAPSRASGALPSLQMQVPGAVLLTVACRGLERFPIPLHRPDFSRLQGHLYRDAAGSGADVPADILRSDPEFGQGSGSDLLLCHGDFFRTLKFRIRKSRCAALSLGRCFRQHAAERREFHLRKRFGSAPVDLLFQAAEQLPHDDGERTESGFCELTAEFGRSELPR